MDTNRMLLGRSRVLLRWDGCTVGLYGAGRSVKGSAINEDCYSTPGALR